MAETLVIEGRFNGPPRSAHGGYVCGVLANRIDPLLAEVTLRSPPPLDAELALREREGGIQLFVGETLLADARRPEPLEIEVPDPVGIEEARRAREASPLHQQSLYADCFVCGPNRQRPDGLRVIAGPIPGRDGVIASPWDVDERLASSDGAVATEFIWSALDCPGGCALMLRPEIGYVMLGRMSAQIVASVTPGASYVALGWPIQHDRRKHLSGSAIFSAEGQLVAVATSLWIELKKS